MIILVLSLFTGIFFLIPPKYVVKSGSYTINGRTYSEYIDVITERIRKKIKEVKEKKGKKVKKPIQSINYT
ncbi:MAG: hypothetical protein ACXACX_22960 [Candidatus Hodarchaeales archaeon]|jgi:hypothetical protein